MWCGVVWCGVVWCSNSGVLLLHADLCHAQPQSPSVAVTPPAYQHHPLSPLSQTLLEMVNLIQEDEVNERVHNLASKYDDIVVTIRCKMKDIFIVDQI